MIRDPRILNIHALDPTRGETLTADSRVFDDLECPASHVVTELLIRQRGRTGPSRPLDPGVIEAQYDAAWFEGAPSAARVGIVRDPDRTDWVASLLVRRPVPSVVLAPTVRLGGDELLDADGVEALRTRLFPLARILVVRFGDLEALGGVRVTTLEEIRDAASRLRDLGPKAVLVSGWVERGRVVDVLDDAGRVTVFGTGRVAAPRIPGLGGAHSAAIAVGVARGRELPEAVAGAQRYIGMRLHRGR